MRLFSLCLGLVCCIVIKAQAQPEIIADTLRPAEERIQNAIDQMTLEEKVRLCFGGERFGEVVLPGVPRLEIGPIYAADGPRGVRAGDVTVFPSGIGLAATWNPQLVEQTGQVIGSESRARGIGMVFGPAFNINRDPLGGRFFEYLTEDPYLNGKLAAAQVRGMQREGVSACIKHFAVNSRDLNRNWYMSRVDERTLREIYLRGYEIAVKEADPWGCMTAANGLNGELCSDNEWLLNEVLKKLLPDIADDIGLPYLPGPVNQEYLLCARLQVAFDQGADFAKEHVGSLLSGFFLSLFFNIIIRQQDRFFNVVFLSRKAFFKTPTCGQKEGTPYLFYGEKNGEIFFWPLALRLVPPRSKPPGTTPGG